MCVRVFPTISANSLQHKLQSLNVQSDLAALILWHHRFSDRPSSPFYDLTTFAAFPPGEQQQAPSRFPSAFETRCPVWVARSLHSVTPESQLLLPIAAAAISNRDQHKRRSHTVTTGRAQIKGKGDSCHADPRSNRTGCSLFNTSLNP